MVQRSNINGKPLSQFAFGCMQFGGAADIYDATEMFEAAYNAGLTHFDCAHLYNDGAAERILGSLIKPYLDHVSFATKIGYHGAEPDRLRQEFELSRKRLGIDCVDLLYLHKFDPLVPLAVQIDVLMGFKAKGWVADFGLSNFAAWQVMKARSLGLPVAAVQPMYSLVKRQAEVEILPMCASEGIACLGYSPLAAGLLTGKYSNPNAIGRLKSDTRYTARYNRSEIHDAAQKLCLLAAEMGQLPSTLAVAWVAHGPYSVSPIVSGRTTDQIAPSLAALSLNLTAEEYFRLSSIFSFSEVATDRIEEVCVGS